MTEFDPQQMGPAIYPLLTSIVVPRPIAWVSTVSAAGVANIAPHSFFTVASVAPPVLQFTSVGVKDSLRNVRETGEFVVHVVSASTSTNFPPELGEFEALSLPTAPSHLVAAPRLAAAGVSVECRSAGERVFGNSVVVFGEIVWITVEDGLLAQDGLVDVAALAPVSRLGRNDWAEVGPRFTLAREPYDHWRSRQ
jgi:flavin reductase (DIM6/NTAB) family NADH-FMN oxidoreductase RutF